jgi:hypothetical protein
MTRATAEQLVRTATARTGLTDFGADGWQEGLDQLVASIAADVHDEDTAARIEAILADKLETRLRIEHWYAEHGDEAADPVEGPLVIIGLPRTATTATHHMLSLDPRLRYLRRWERDQPLPPPDLATESSDPRRTVPEASAMHIRTVDGPAEDGPLQMLDLRSGYGLPLPTFERWWNVASHPTALAYQDRVMRLLHSHRPPHHWLLKYPSYTYQLDDVVAQWPDARLVWTHRDPVKQIPSTCSVIVDGHQRRIPGWQPDDLSSFGHEVLERFAGSARRGAEVRARLGDERFLDVGQREMEADAVAVAERIYEFAGLPLDDHQRTVIADWADSNKKGSRGTHSYSAEQYGLTDDEIRDAFADYLVEYGRYCA